MKELFAEIHGAVMATLVLSVVCCGFYPLVVFAVARVAFADKANGSLIVDSHGIVRGSRLVGQGFTSDRYFHPRPSAAGNGYDATASGGSNLGPTSQKLADAVKDHIAEFRAGNKLGADVPVPADAVTASGSGLDPHISPDTARLQVNRVAAARGLPAERVAALVQRFTESPQCGILGEPRVNVLLLNLALDQQPGTR